MVCRAGCEIQGDGAAASAASPRDKDRASKHIEAGGRNILGGATSFPLAIVQELPSVGRLASCRLLCSYILMFLIPVIARPAHVIARPVVGTVPLIR